MSIYWPCQQVGSHQFTWSGDFPNLVKGLPATLSRQRHQRGGSHKLTCCGKTQKEKKLSLRSINIDLAHRCVCTHTTQSTHTILTKPQAGGGGQKDVAMRCNYRIKDTCRLLPIDSTHSELCPTPAPPPPPALGATFALLSVCISRVRDSVTPPDLIITMLYLSFAIWNLSSSHTH